MVRLDFFVSNYYFLLFLFKSTEGKPLVFFSYIFFSLALEREYTKENKEVRPLVYYSLVSNLTNEQE